MHGAPSKEDKPHYHGHRDRLRQRFADGGADGFADYELLELILFMAIPRRDVKPLAKSLIARFGNFAGVLQADIAELRAAEGVSENTAIALKAIQAGAYRMMKQDIMKRPVLSNWNRLIDYCQATMGHEKKEFFRVLFMNKKNELIADEIQQSGSVDHTPVYPREILKRSMDLGATAIILVHNHPSGDPNPSQVDVDMTHAIIEAGRALSISVHDHIIISRYGHSSFKTMGLI
jgi:DNA repair protein RadC